MGRSDFHDIELVHIGIGPAAITAVSQDSVEYTDDQGQRWTIDLNECGGNFTSMGHSPEDVDMLKNQEQVSLLVALCTTDHRGSSSSIIGALSDTAERTILVPPLTRANPQCKI
jgi:hypothetical protein